MGTLLRFITLAVCSFVFLQDTANSQGYYYENVNKYNLVNGRLQLVPPPQPPRATTPEPGLMETIFPWMGDAYDSAKTPEEDAAILNSISDDPMPSSSNGDSGGSSWFSLPGLGSLTSSSEQQEVYEHPNYAQPPIYGNSNNMQFPHNNPMAAAASQSQPLVMPGPDQHGFMQTQPGPIASQHGPMPPQQGPMASQQGHMTLQHGSIQLQQDSIPHKQIHTPPHQSLMPPQQSSPPNPGYPGVKVAEPEKQLQMHYSPMPTAPMIDHEPEKLLPMHSQNMPLYSPMHISEPEHSAPYQGQQYPYMPATAQSQSPQQYPYNIPNAQPTFNFHQQVKDSIPLPGPYGLSGFNQPMFPYPYSTNLPFDQGQGPNLPTVTTEKPTSLWETLTNFFTFGKRNDLEGALYDSNFAVARSMQEDEQKQIKDDEAEADATLDDDDEDSMVMENNDEDSSSKEAESSATNTKPDKEKDFPCPKTGIWKWNGDVCIAVGPIPVWACRPNDLIVSGKIAICRNKIYFSPQKLMQPAATPN